jgi:hypothetical protein
MDRNNLTQFSVIKVARAVRNGGVKKKRASKVEGKLDYVQTGRSVHQTPPPVATHNG